jgi:phosphocarrier protein
MGTIEGSPPDSSSGSASGSSGSASGSSGSASGAPGSELVVEVSVTVRNRNGLHARPSSVLAETALRFADTSLMLRRAETEVDAKSIMELLLLEAGPGTELTLIARGPEAEEAVAALQNLFEREFDLHL